MIDTKELRRLAQAATPGPWVSQGRYIGTPRHMSYIGEVRDQCGNWSDTEKSRSYSAYIAAANPAVIIELLDRLEAAEKERENANAAAAGIALQAETLQAERDALRKELMAAHKMAMNGTEWRDLAKKYAARIEEMERQEPYAFALCSGWARKAVYLSEIEACEQRDRRQLTADLGGSLEAYRVVPLYLAPGAQPAPSVPDGWKLVPIEPTQEMSEAGVFAGGIYYDVVEAAYEAMIAAAPEAKP